MVDGGVLFEASLGGRIAFGKLARELCGEGARLEIGGDVDVVREETAALVVGGDVAGGERGGITIKININNNKTNFITIRNKNLLKQKLKLNIPNDFI